VAYVNLDEGKFLREAGAMLKAGYVLTVDYGGNWNKVSEVDIEHLRVFGPEPGDVPPSPDLGAEVGPYFWPTYYDLTTDVNFSHMADEAKESKLEPVFFGPQSNLLLGTGLRLEEVPESKDATFFEWTLNFFNWQAYKMLIERKAGTDPAYVFPRGEAEPLEVDLKTLTAQQQALARKVAVALGRIQ
jgi:SAM-dependent MidA family methyltransferase